MGRIELDEAEVDRIEALRTDGFPVLSLFLGQDGPVRGSTARLKTLLKPILEQSSELSRAAGRSVTADVDRILGLGERLTGDGGQGVAVFACTGADLFGRIDLPAPARDRAVLSDRPYVRPLRAMLSELHRYCAVVLDRRRAEIFEFRFGRLEHWEQMNEEEVRKSNYGGFGGYDEVKVRSHGDEVAHRHFRDTAARLSRLMSEEPFDLLLVGGQSESIDGLVAELRSDIRPLLAGTFPIDMRTMTPALVSGRCAELAAAHDVLEQGNLVNELIDAAKGGGSAVLGLGWVIDAVNQKAVYLLVIDTSDSVEGWECGACGWITAEPTSVCPACSANMRPAPDLLDAAGRAVEASGGRVRHVFVDTALADSHVGALLRFPVAYQAS
ncbi:MAG: hypothetical protein OEM22_06095 [Acidimicrobiia bacterium]|nr:hypothetical protein [Acidimicrobiia bacterium]MDH3471280.1 hypothetical protein [Acidimicrobiia bacterium]